jgi:hypothetical protein
VYRKTVEARARFFPHPHANDVRLFVLFFARVRVFLLVDDDDVAVGVSGLPSFWLAYLSRNSQKHNSALVLSQSICFYPLVISWCEWDIERCRMVVLG